MKTLIVISVVSAFIAFGNSEWLPQSLDSNSPVQHSVQLTPDETALIKGEGCSLSEWILTLGAWAGYVAIGEGVDLVVIGSCLAAIGGSIDCLNIGGSSGPTPVCLDPCYGVGGGPEPGWACSANGGYVTGGLFCAQNAQEGAGGYVCCAYNN